MNNIAAWGGRLRSVNSVRSAVHSRDIAFSASTPLCLPTGEIVWIAPILSKYFLNVAWNSDPPSVCTSVGVP